MKEPPKVEPWRDWLIDGVRRILDVALGMAVIFGALGLFYFTGIQIKFDFSKNSPEIAYITAGIMGGAVAVHLPARRRLRLEQESVLQRRRRSSLSVRGVRQ